MDLMPVSFLWIKSKVTSSDATGAVGSGEDCGKPASRCFNECLRKIAAAQLDRNICPTLSVLQFSKRSQKSKFYFKKSF